MRRKEVFPFGEGRCKKERLRGGGAASGRRASRTSAPEAGGGRAGRTAPSQGVGPALGSEARRPQVFGGSTAHRPWNAKSSRMRTIYGSGTGSNDTHSRSEFSLEETPKRQETTLGYGSANQRGEAARRTGALEGTKLTLKNQGYCFERNHGEKNLSTVFALMLAFLLNSDVASWQAQMEARRSSYFREKVRGLFLNCFLKDWETLCVRASSGNSHNHRRDRVCRSRFFRGNRIVKAMSAPDRARWVAAAGPLATMLPRRAFRECRPLSPDISPERIAWGLRFAVYVIESNQYTFREGEPHGDRL